MRNFPQVAKNSPTLRVLIVEDERLIRWSIAETLEHAGHVVIEAEDGASAIRSLTNLDEPVDAVVLDYRLPDSNDLALLAHIRRLSPRSAVILMTAFGTPEITRAALDLGVYQVLNKPFEMHDLAVAACAGLRVQRAALVVRVGRLKDRRPQISVTHTQRSASSGGFPSPTTALSENPTNASGIAVASSIVRDDPENQSPSRQ